MSSRSDDAPRKEDFLVGRKYSCQENLGNELVRTLVETHHAEYEFGDTEKRRTLREMIVKKVRETGGRFLRRPANGVGWMILSDKEASERVCGAFTNKRRSVTRAKKKAPSGNGERRNVVCCLQTLGDNCDKRSSGNDDAAFEPEKTSIEALRLHQGRLGESSRAEARFQIQAETLRSQSKTNIKVELPACGGPTEAIPCGKEANFDFKDANQDCFDVMSFASNRLSHGSCVGDYECQRCGFPNRDPLFCAICDRDRLSGDSAVDGHPSSSSDMNQDRHQEKEHPYDQRRISTGRLRAVTKQYHGLEGDMTNSIPALDSTALSFSTVFSTLNIDVLDRGPKCVYGDFSDDEFGVKEFLTLFNNDPDPDGFLKEHGFVKPIHRKRLCGFNAWFLTECKTDQKLHFDRPVWIEFFTSWVRAHCPSVASATREPKEQSLPSSNRGNSKAVLESICDDMSHLTLSISHTSPSVAAGNLDFPTVFDALYLDLHDDGPKRVMANFTNDLMGIKKFMALLHQDPHDVLRNQGFVKPLHQKRLLGFDVWFETVYLSETRPPCFTRQIWLEFFAGWVRDGCPSLSQLQRHSNSFVPSEPWCASVMSLGSSEVARRQDTNAASLASKSGMSVEQEERSKGRIA